MPIEINELVVRAVVEDAPSPRREGSDAAGGEAEREAIVAACVKEVLRILRRKEER